MSWELHYTSVPRGLYPGSKGFCVVATTPNLPAPLRERLEGLSGYQQVFPPHDPRAGLNPVVLAHHRLNLGGRPLSVLSRVAFAGLDYTDRSNKYAHHVVIDPSERPAGGPAWLLGRPDFLERAWSGEPRILPPGRTIPRGDAAPAVASAWRSATGDAGWAGALAEAFSNNPSRPAYLIYEPGFDPLPLFAEALSLLPPSRRWDVDFNTYFSVAPQGLTCAWRGVLAGTPAAGQALKAPGALVLDLTRPMGPPGDGPLIQQARTGERPAASQPTPAPAPRARATLADNPAPSLLPDDDIPTVELVPVPPPAPKRGVRTAERTRTPAASRSRFHASRLWFAAAAVLLLLLGGGSAFLYFGGNPEADALIDRFTKRSPKDEAEAKPPAPDPKPAPPPEQPNVAEAPKPNVEPPKPEPPPPPEAQPVAVAEPPKQEASPSADPDFVYQPMFMDLPELPAAGLSGEGRELKPTPPLKLGAKVLKVKLHQLTGGEKIPGKTETKPALTLRDPVSSGGAAIWGVGPNDEDKTSLAYIPYDIAEIRIQPKALVLAWSDKGVSSEDFARLAEILRDSVLELETDQGRKFVVLRDLKPADKPFQLSGRRGPAGEGGELTLTWASGAKLSQSQWEWSVRRYRIDVTVADPNNGSEETRLLSEENADQKDKRAFVLIPNTARLELKPAKRVDKEGRPQTDKVSIVLKLDEQENQARGQQSQELAAKIQSDREKLDAASKKKPDKKKTEALKDSIAKKEKQREELEGHIRKYEWIKNNNGASLSLILGLRLDDGRFLDLARIGTYAEGGARK